MNPSLRTKAAAKYLTDRGLQTSPSWLEKARTRGADDTRDRGPDWFRDSSGTCWYDIASLDRYATQRLAARRFRAPAEQPEQFRRTG